MDESACSCCLPLAGCQGGGEPSSPSSRPSSMYDKIPPSKYLMKCCNEITFFLVCSVKCKPILKLGIVVVIMF